MEQDDARVTRSDNPEGMCGHECSIVRLIHVHLGMRHFAGHGNQLHILTSTMLAMRDTMSHATDMQVDHILQAISDLQDNMQSHQEMRDVRWKLLEALGLKL
jgi:hypothetical protein